MYLYQIKCVLYTPHYIAATDLCTTDALPDVPTPHTFDLKEQHNLSEQTLNSSNARNKRRSSSLAPVTAANISHAPPTPVQNRSTTTAVTTPMNTDPANSASPSRLLATTTQQSQEDANSDSCLNFHVDFRLGSIRINESVLGDGIIYLHRAREALTAAADINAHDTTLEEQLLLKAVTKSNDIVLCVLAIPAYMTHTDILAFFQNVSARFYFIHDASINKYMGILKFKEPIDAFRCYQKYSGRRYNMTEPEACHLVYLTSFKIFSFIKNENEIAATATAAAAAAVNKYPYMNITAAATAGKDDSVELPTCPLCLERLDESITGLKHASCYHNQLQCQCLNGWFNTTCFACRRLQQLHPVQAKGVSDAAGVKVVEDRCFECELTKTETPSAFTAATPTTNQELPFSSIWICMICGHKGCGRYQEAHAYDHFTCTKHTLAIAIDSQYIWDYYGDKYVHRLIQTEQGRVNELPSLSTASSDNHRRQCEQQPQHRATLLQHPTEIADEKEKSIKTRNLEHGDGDNNNACSQSELLQTGTDSSSSGDGSGGRVESKMDRMASEYTMMATTQLDSQRMYYEQQLASLLERADKLKKAGNLQERQLAEEKQTNHALEEQKKHAMMKLALARKEKEKLDRRLVIVKEKTEQLGKQLTEEQMLTKSLVKKQESLQQKASTNEDIVKQLTEKLEYLMSQL